MASLSQSRRTTCPYCGIGCGVLARPQLESGNSSLEVVQGDPQHPANLGRLCVKGAALHETLGEHGRLLHPQIGKCRTDWNTALDAVAVDFSRVIKQHGPDAVAFYLSGQLLTEDYYVANKLMKGFIGSANVDTNSRLCMSSAVAAYKRAFGADAVPCCYEDLECCDLLVLIGSNAAWTHPVLYQRIVAARALRPQMRIVVIDPRRTASCDSADLHLAIRPGSDGFVFTGLLHFLHARGRLDQDFIAQHTEGFEAALGSACDLATAAEACGLPPSELEQFYQWFADTQRTVSFYSQGVNQSATGTDKCNAIINCHLATGRIGRPGMGPFSITGQPNAMGGREVGGLANQLASHMDFTPQNIDRLSRFWGSRKVARRPGLMAVEMFEAVAQGRIRAIWIMGSNPVVSLPDSRRIRAALQGCELVVVSDCIEQTDTTLCADVLLPACGWAEKDGTVTNSERRISRQRALLPPAGESRPDWWIVAQLAARMGYSRHFNYTSAADIFREHARLSCFENGLGAGQRRAFDIGGLADLDDQQYESLTPVQWPVPDTYDPRIENGKPIGTKRLFKDQRFYTPSGRARFIAVVAQLPTSQWDHPFTLNTGRLRDQWHTMTRTGRSSRLMEHVDAPCAALNPRDAMSAGIGQGDLLRLSNEQGELLLQAVIDEGQRDGEVFVPIHWNEQYASHGRVSELVPPVVDLHSGQPQSKYSRVALQAVPTSSWLQVLSPEPLPTRDLDYWVRTPLSTGWRYLLAFRTTVQADPSSATALLLDRLEPLYQGLQRMEFADSARQVYQALFCDEQQIRLALFSAVRHDQLPAASRLASLLGQAVTTDAWRELAGIMARSATTSGAGRIICSCHQVSQASIVAAVEEGACNHVELGRKLRCGTNCGSCIPELRQLIAATLRESGEPADKSGRLSDRLFA